MYKRVLFLDLETYSDQDINFGSYAYSDSENFMILLLAYAFDDEPVKLVDLQQEKVPEEVGQALTDPEILKVAHNASFERIALSRFLGYSSFLKSDDWLCTMSYASFFNIPSSLEKAGHFLAIPDQKMEEGMEGILFFCRPENSRRHLPQENPTLWKTFCRYCIRDVEAMREIYYRLQQLGEFPKVELDLYHLDQKINDRGFLLDLEASQRILEKEKEFSRDLQNLVYHIDPFIRVGSNKTLRTFLKYNGIRLRIVNEEILQDLLKKEIPDSVRQVINGWLKYHHSVSKKVQNTIRMADRGDNRIRGALRYFGNQNGTWSFRGISPYILENNPDTEPFIYEKMTPEGSQTIQYTASSLNELIIPEDGFQFLLIRFSARKQILDWLQEEYLKMNPESHLFQSIQSVNDSGELLAYYKTLLFQDISRYLYNCLIIAQRFSMEVHFLGPISFQIKTFNEKRYFQLNDGYKPWTLFDFQAGNNLITYLPRPKKKNRENLERTPEEFLEEIIEVINRDLFASFLLHLDQAGFSICFIDQFTIVIEAKHEEYTDDLLTRTIETWKSFLPVKAEFEMKWEKVFVPFEKNPD